MVQQFHRPRADKPDPAAPAPKNNPADAARLFSVGGERMLSGNRPPMPAKIFEPRQPTQHTSKPAMPHYVLSLNDMRTTRVEILSEVCWHEHRAALEAFVESQRAPHRDGKWAKPFASGGPLEWYNDYVVGIDEIPTLDELGRFEETTSRPWWCAGALAKVSLPCAYVPHLDEVAVK